MILVETGSFATVILKALIFKKGILKTFLHFKITKHNLLY